MEKNHRLPIPHFRAIAAGLFLSLSLVACGKSGDSATLTLAGTDRTVMGEYEDIRAALAGDDLRTAKKAATAMADTLKPAGSAPASPMLKPASDLADAPALDRARQIFKTMSVQAINLTKGAKGFYVVNCPMTPNGDWVQTNQTIDNPYMGKIMHDCGVVKK